MSNNSGRSKETGGDLDVDARKKMTGTERFDDERRSSKKSGREKKYYEQSEERMGQSYCPHLAGN
jgi:hypothetical protein